MPELREILQFTVIALVVPLQLYLSGYFSSEPAYVYTSKAKANILEWQFWHDICTDLLERLAIWRKPSGSASKADGTIKSNDKEFWQTEGHNDELLNQFEGEDLDFNDPTAFGGSEEPRLPRSRSVHYHVGQVVRHREFKFRGVIIGWDESARAPKRWLAYTYGNRPHLAKIPSYKVLVDTRDRRQPQFAYIAQVNLEPATDGTRIIHPNVDQFFERFDASIGAYVPRPFLSNIYPHDDPRSFRLPSTTAD